MIKYASNRSNCRKVFTKIRNIVLQNVKMCATRLNIHKKYRIFNHNVIEFRNFLCLLGVKIIRSNIMNMQMNTNPYSNLKI